MKIVRLQDNVVYEIIPEYALPVEKWYGSEFAAHCVEAPSEVEQGWIYDDEAKTFSKPTPAPEPQLDDITALQLAVAELAEQQAADQTANELALAELAETMIGG